MPLITRWLRSLLGEPIVGVASSEDAPPAGGPPADAGTPAGSDQSLSDWSSQIEKVLAANQHLPPGQVNLITLERLQELLGDRWAELEEKVHQTAERIIRRQTGESDIFARYSATEYLVMFSGLSAKAAQLRCMEIAEAIYSFYLGEVPADAVSIKSGVARGAEGLAFVEYSQHHLLETHRREAQESPASLQEADQTPRERSTADPEPLAAKQAVASSEDIEPSSANAVAGESPGNDSLPRPRHATGVWSENSQNPVSPPAAPQEEEQARPLRFLYTPLWDLRSHVLSAYFCVVETSDVRRRWNNSLPTPSPEDARTLVVEDLETLRECIEFFSRTPRREIRCILAIPVHYETLASVRWRQLFLDFAISISRRMRPFIVIELVGLPEGIVHGRLLELVGFLKPFTRTVLARVPLHVKSLEAFARTGLHAVGADLDQADGSEKELLTAIERFAIEAEQAGLWTYLHNVSTPSLAIAAAASGIRYIDGVVVGDTASRPRELERFGWDDFVERMKLTAVLDEQRQLGDLPADPVTVDSLTGAYATREAIG